MQLIVAYCLIPPSCWLMSPWWLHQMETFSELLALCVGNSPIIGEFPTQRRSLIWAWINCKVNNREAGDLRRHLAYYDVNIMPFLSHTTWLGWPFINQNSSLAHLPLDKMAPNLADDIFMCIFMNGKFCILIRISPKFVPKVQIYNMPALVQVMAWRRTSNKPLSEPMLTQFIDAYMRHWGR